MKLAKNDFVELEFTGRLKDNGEIFDSNISNDLKQAGHQDPDKIAKPFIFPLGHDMFLKAIDEFLIGKDLGEYKLDLSADQAFGQRNPQLVKLVSKNIFKQHNLNPVPGASFNFDGRVARILSVSGGRVMADFNNPLAGKDLVYDLKVLRKIEDLSEQITAFSDFIFRQKLEFELKDKNVVFSVPKAMLTFVEMFKQKFKEIFNLELLTKEQE